MHERPGGRGEQLEQRKRDGGGIDAHGQCDAQLDGGNRGVGQALEIGDFGNIIAHQRDVRRLYGDIASHAAHRHANVRRFECGRIVDPIADHAHGVPIRLQLFQMPDFFRGQQPGVYRRDTRLRGKIRGGLRIIPGEQHRICVHPAQAGDHLPGRRAQHVGQSDHADALPVPRDQDGCFARGAQRLQLCADGCPDVNSMRQQIGLVAAEQLAA